MVFANDSMPLWRTESRNQSCRDGAVIPFGRTASIRLRISSGRRSWGRVVFLALVWPCIARQLDAGVGRNGQNVGGGIMLTRRLFGFEARAKGELVRAEGLEPSRTLRSNGFSYLLRLSPPPTAFAMGFGVWTIPSPCPDLAPGIRCCPSSLYTFPAFSGRAWLGIAMLQGSPNLSSSASPVSRRALKFSLKSDASADSATPARFQVSTNERLTRSDF